MNDAPTGKVTILGQTWSSQTLSVDTSTLKDADGLPAAGEFAYQWYADGEAINDANAQTLVLTDDFIGESISVEVSYLDGGDTEERVVSEETVQILPKDSPTDGTLNIVGLSRQGQVLLAQEALYDDDGIGDGPIQLQWLADGAAIAGQTTDALVLTQALVGKKISVNATYTDGHGNVDSFTSSATSSVANINDAPTGSVTINGVAKQGLVLTASNTLADLDGMGLVSYQWKANGVNITGATTSTYKLTQYQVGQKITVAATYTDNFGAVESKTSLSTAAVVTAYSVAASSSSVNEGSALTFTATTSAVTDLPAGGKITYTLGGVTAADVEGGLLTGTATVDGTGKAVFLVKMAADYLTEGTETLTANVFGASVKVTVSDASTAASSTNWSLLSNGGALTFNPNTDRLVINNNALSAKDFYLTWSATTAVTLVGGGKSVTLNTDIKSLTSTNLVFSDGSSLLVGDNTTLVASDDGPNTLAGTAGNDKLYGLGGADTFLVGAGTDSITDLGNGGADILVVASGAVANATINAAWTATASTSNSGVANISTSGLAVNLAAVTGGASGFNVTYAGVATTLTGSAWADSLTGGVGNDTLNGGAGNDTLNGGAGNDSMTGGLGMDRFVIASGDSGRTTGWDVITDYLKAAAGSGDLIDYTSSLVVGGSTSAATTAQASINASTGVATFATGTGTTLADAVAKIDARFVAATDSAGEFSFFKVNNAGDYYLYVSDGTTATTDVVVQLVGVTTIGGISLSNGDLTITS